jgi:hypothetical protein
MCRGTRGLPTSDDLFIAASQGGRSTSAAVFGPAVRVQRSWRSGAPARVPNQWNGDRPSMENTTRYISALAGAALLAAALTPAIPVPSAQAAPATPAPNGETAGFLDNGITAHCGYSGAYLENTMTSMRRGIEVGADWIELDVFLSKDGQVVVNMTRRPRGPATRTWSSPTALTNS